MHIRSFVISYEDRVKEPWIPEDYEYTEHVRCDWCEKEDLSKKDLLDSFVGLLQETLNEPGVTGKVIKGVCKVVIPKGAVRKFIEGEVVKIKEAASKVTVDEYASTIHDVLRLVDYLNPFDNVFIAITDDGEEDYDTCTRSLYYTMEFNDKEDTVVYVYGSIKHHI